MRYILTMFGDMKEEENKILHLMTAKSRKEEDPEKVDKTKEGKRYEPTFPKKKKENGKRGFERVNRKKETKMPRRATTASAGYDIFSLETTDIYPGETKILATNVKAYMQEDEVLKIYGRSSLAIKEKLVMATGVSIIDADYYNNEENEGEIILAMRNEGKEPVLVRRGQAIAQGIFQKYLTCGDEPEEKRSGGIGSTD